MPIADLTIVLVAAVARNGVVGLDNALPWRLPEDLQHFRALTIGHSVLMGRRTWESLPARFKPLPGRRNIVLTRQHDWQAVGATVVHELDDAWTQARATAEDGIDNSRIFVIGGAELYAQTLKVAEELRITEIDHDFVGDAHFPSWSHDDFVEVARDAHRAAAPNDFDFAFVTWRRRAACLA